MNNNDRVIESLKFPSETSQTSFPSPGLLSLFSLQDLLTAELLKLWTLNNMESSKLLAFPQSFAKHDQVQHSHSTDLMDQLLCYFTFCCCNKTLTTTTWRKVTHPVSQLEGSQRSKVMEECYCLVPPGLVSHTVSVDLCVCVRVGILFLFRSVSISPRKKRDRRGGRKHCMWPLSTSEDNSPGSRLWRISLVVFQSIRNIKNWRAGNNF